MFDFLFGGKKKQKSHEPGEFNQKLIDNFDDGFSRKGDFSFQVEDVFQISGRGVVVTGKIDNGQVTIGDKVQWIGSDDRVKGEVTIKGIEMFRKVVDTACAGENVGLLLEDIYDKSKIDRGDKFFR